MAYTPSGYEWGDSGSWNSPAASVTIQYNADSGLAFVHFSGLSSILSGSISAATLHLTWLFPVAGTANIHVYGVKFEDPPLPGSWSGGSTYYTDYLSIAHPTFDADGLTAKDLDVTSLISELAAAYEGDSICLILTQVGYSGASVADVTCTLDVTAGGGGGGSSPGGMSGMSGMSGMIV